MSSEGAIISQNIDLAAQILAEGKPIGIPTETVYGLAANALNNEAVIQTYEIKERPRFNPLIVHTHAIEEIEKYVVKLSSLERKLLTHFSPGPLTLLIKKNHFISDLVTAGSPFAGFRIPNHPLTLALLRSLSFPLTAPSANKFGKISPTSPQDVFRQLGQEITYILDGGICQIGVESTVIKVEATDIYIYREGAITREMLEVYGQVKSIEKTQKLHSPGRVKYHYSPDIPTYIYQEEIGKDLANSAIINFQHLKSLPFQKQKVLSSKGDLHEAAQNIFRYLNELNTEPYSAIYLELVPQLGIGRAINDKIRKAAARYEDTRN